MQLSKIELISASLGILVLFATGTGYLMVLKNEVNNLKAEQSERDEEFKGLGKKIDIFMSESLKKITKDKDELNNLKSLLEERYRIEKELLTSNLLDESKKDIDNGKYKTSIAKLLEAISKKPSADAHYYLAQSYKGDKSLSSALTSINEAIKIDSNNYLYFYEKGMIYRDKRKYDTAIENYKKSLDMGNNDREIYNSMRHAYHYNNDLPNALIYAKKYVTVAGGDSGSYYLRGYTYRAMGNCKEAVKDFNKTIEIEGGGGYGSHRNNAKKYMDQCNNKDTIHKTSKIPNNGFEINSKYWILKEYSKDYKKGIDNTISHTGSNSAYIESVVEKTNKFTTIPRFHPKYRKIKGKSNKDYIFHKNREC